MFDLETIQLRSYIITTISANILFFLFFLLFSFILVSTVVICIKSRRNLRKLLKMTHKTEKEIEYILLEQNAIFLWRLSFFKSSSLIFFLAFCLRIVITAIRFFDNWLFNQGFSETLLIPTTYYNLMSSYKFVIYALVAITNYLIFTLIFQKRITLLEKLRNELNSYNNF